MKLSEVPMEKLMEALPKLTTSLAGDPVAFNLTTDIEEGRVAQPDWHLRFNDAGDIECGPGHVSDEGTITFVLKQGGLNTLLGMMLDGLTGGSRSASMAMMMGKVGIEPFSPANLKRTESFFKRIKLGEDAQKTALKEVGVEVDDIDI